MKFKKLNVLKTIALMLVMVITVSVVPVTAFALETSANIRSLISFIGDFDNTKLSNENYSEKYYPADSHPGYWDEEWVDMELYKYYELSDEITDISLNGSLRVDYGSNLILFINEMNWDNVYFSGDTISEIPRKLWLFQKNIPVYIEKNWTYYNSVLQTIPSNYSSILSEEENNILVGKWNAASNIGMEATTTQETFDIAVKELEDYIKLVFAGKYADYTALDKLYELTSFALLTGDEKSQLDSKYNSYSKNHLAGEQSIVDAYYNDFLNTVLTVYGLSGEYSSLCDYTSVVDACNSLKGYENLFSSEEIQTWNESKQSINWKLGYSAQNQRIVDEYANNLFTQSISLKNNLVMRVNNEMQSLLNRFYGLDKNLYEENSYNEAKNFADRQMTNITIDEVKQQKENIEEMKRLIDNLVLKSEVEPADYTMIEHYKKLANEIDRTIYTEESLSVLDSAINAIVYGLKQGEQQRVDDMASNLKSSYEALVIKGADYTELNVQVERYEQLRRHEYTEESFEIVTNIVESIQWNLLVTRQSDVDKYASDLEKAIDNLKLKPANFTRLDRVISTLPEDYFKYYDNLKGVQDVLAVIDRNVSFKEQSKVNKWADDLEVAISQLVLKDADYTELNKLLESIPKDLTVYSKKSVKNLNDVVNSLNFDLTIFEQDKVDEMVERLKTAINGLTLKETTFKALVGLLEEVEGELTGLFSSVEDLIASFKSKIKEKHENEEIIVNIYNVDAMSNTDEEGWVLNALELKDKIKVVLPYPENIEKNKYDFYVYHMFAKGNKGGEMETLEVEVTNDGLVVYSKDFSPYAVVAVEKKVQEPGNNNNEGVGVPGGSSQQPEQGQKPVEDTKAPQTGDPGFAKELLTLLGSSMTLLGAACISLKKKKEFE